MKRALLLNSTYEPLNFISDVRAITLLLKGRAEVVTVSDSPSEWDEAFVTPSTRIPVPATLRLLTRVNRKRTPLRFKKRILFNRDNWQCQYCFTELVYHNITIEHILPVSRGGETSYRNCVAACRPCNRRKANQTPEEANMRLRRPPTDPSPLHFWDVKRSTAWHSDWNVFVPTSG